MESPKGWELLRGKGYEEYENGTRGGVGHKTIRKTKGKVNGNVTIKKEGKKVGGGGRWKQWGRWWWAYLKGII